MRRQLPAAQAGCLLLHPAILFTKLHFMVSAVCWCREILPFLILIQFSHVCINPPLSKFLRLFQSQSNLKVCLHSGIFLPVVKMKFSRQHKSFLLSQYSNNVIIFLEHLLDRFSCIQISDSWMCLCKLKYFEGKFRNLFASKFRNYSVIACLEHMLPTVLLN